MFEIQRAVKAAIQELPDVTVISSSWKSTRQVYPLPAIIVDLDKISPSERSEDGEVIARTHSIPISINVSLQNRTDDEAESDLEELSDSFEQAIVAAFGNNYEILDWYPMNVTFGKSDVLCGSFMLTIDA